MTDNNRFRSTEISETIGLFPLASSSERFVWNDWFDDRTAYWLRLQAHEGSSGIATMALGVGVAYGLQTHRGSSGTTEVGRLVNLVRVASSQRGFVWNHRVDKLFPPESVASTLRGFVWNGLERLFRRLGSGASTP